MYNIEKQMVPCKSTAEEVSFEWSHHTISYTDSKVRTTQHVSITDSGNERVERKVTVGKQIIEKIREAEQGSATYKRTKR